MYAIFWVWVFRVGGRGGGISRQGGENGEDNETHYESENPVQYFWGQMKLLF